MAFSSNLTTPNLGTEPPEQTSPEFSVLSSPPSEIDSISEFASPQLETVDSEQVIVGSHNNPPRRSARQRKPTSKLDQSERAPPAKISPKRRKTGAGQWISPPTTVTSNTSKSTSVANNEVEKLQQLVPTLSRLNSHDPNSSNIRSRDHLVRNIVVPIPSVLVARPKAIEQADMERDLKNAFLAKLRGQVYQLQYDDEDREKYFENHGSTKDRIANQSHMAWKEKTSWPGYDTNKPIHYDINGRIVTASSDGEKSVSNQGSEAPSPSLKGSKSAQTGKNGKNGGRNGNRSNKGRGTGGGKDRDSPEPPAKPILDQDERLTLSQLRQRQVELKKFFSTVGGQQKEALELMVSRDLAKLQKKNKHHTKTPEYSDVMQSLQDRENDIKGLIDEQHMRDLRLADTELEAQEEVIHSQFNQRVEESQREHTHGAQGDLVIFRKAHLTAKDETRTNNGSDIEPYFPRYHELPEADAAPRGYASSHIQDEKPFKEHLASYDEQANQEVIDDDIVAPVAQSVAEENARRQADEEQKALFEALVTITREELRQERGYLIPRPRSSPENPQFALSRLADCAEYISRKKSSEKEYILMPLAPADIETFPLHHLERVPTAVKTEDSRPSTSTSQSRPPSAKKPLVQRQKSVSISFRRPDEEEFQNRPPSDSATLFPLIAPAPVRRPSLSMAVQSVSLAQMPPPPTASVPPSPSQTTSRRSSLAPLLMSRPPSAASPPTPVTAQPATSIPPPPSPSRFGGPLYPMFPTMLGQSSPVRPGYPFSQQSYHPAQPPPPPRFDPAPPVQSPLDYNSQLPQVLNIQHRFPSAPSPASRPRVGGPRREPGQITFTPAQTPDSERFKNPPQPQPLPPGQAVYRPNSLQQLNSARNSSPVVVTTVAPPDTNSRSQQAADVARQTASINQGQGAGPKGGRRILLPKRY